MCLLVRNEEVDQMLAVIPERSSLLAAGPMDTVLTGDTWRQADEGVKEKEK